MNTINTTPGTWYCIFCTAPATVTAEIDGEFVTLAALDSEGRETFCAPAESISIDTDGKFRVLPTRASAGTSGGGYINSNFRVGHGAADAVQAVCTLTLGNLSQGGTLTDGTTTLTLDPPDETAGGSTRAEGWVPIGDATAAGSVTFGEHEPVVFDEAAPTRAAGWLQVGAGGGDWLINGEPLLCPSPYNSVEAWNYALSGFGLFCTDESLEVGSPRVNIAAIVPGAAGNEITLESPEPDSWPVSGPTLTGGTDGSRTAADIAAVLEALDYISETQVDADEGGITLTAAHAGVNDPISVEGDLFGSEYSPIGMAGGALSYTQAEIVSAINAETDFAVTAAAAETEDAITLTANTAGAAANATTYTAMGCFGGGRVRQGSTVRGRNAVEQTDFKVYVNGEELFGESTVVVDAVEANNANAVTSNAVWNALQEIDVDPAPVPTALTPTTAMKNGGVYTITAAGSAQDFSAISLPANATAEVWVECTATTSITWPPAWVWLDGSAPDVKRDQSYEASHAYRVVVRNEGEGLRIVAGVAYNYKNPLPID